MVKIKRQSKTIHEILIEYHMIEVKELNITEAIENKIDKSKWLKFKFSDLVENIVEKVVPKNSGLSHYIGLEHLDSGSLKIRRFGETASLIGDKLKIYKGDIIFAKRNAYLKRVAIAEFDAVASAHSLVLRPKPRNVIPEFLPFFLFSEIFWERAIEISVGSLSPTINWKILAKQEFFLPPKDQQVQLAELFWAMDGVVESNIKHLDQLLHFKHHLLNNRINDFSYKQKNTTLGEIGKWTSGGTPSKKVKEYWDNGHILWISPKDMKESIITSSIDMVTEKAVNQGKSKLFKKGSTVLVWRSGILQHTLPIAQIEFDFTINQDLKVYQAIQDYLLEDFVRIYLILNSEKIRRECVKEGTTVQSISTDTFMQFKIPIINKTQQEIIIREEDKIRIAILNTQSNLQNSRSLQKSLINQVF